MVSLTGLYQLPESSTLGDSRIQILPDGHFRSEDGRPEEVPFWILDSAAAQSIINAAAQRTRDTVIDYEHQTLSKGVAPAAGWYHNLDYVPGAGLFITDARWTSAAINHIRKREYRYTSAVFTYSRTTGLIQRILHVAITNDPAIDGMGEVLKAAAKRDTIPASQLSAIELKVCEATGIDPSDYLKTII